VGFSLAATIVVLWFGVQMSTVMPVVRANPASKNYVAPSKRSISKAVNSLERLYHLAKFLGFDGYASSAIGSAGKALSLKKDKASNLQAQYYFLKSIEEAEKAALSKDGLLTSADEKMDPLFEAYLEYSRFLKVAGEPRKAKRALKKAKKLADKTQSKSARVKDIQQAIHKLNIKSI